MILRLCLVLAFVGIARPSEAQTVYRVRAGANGANDGSSWAHAFASLRSALEVAGDGDEVWVAEGIYRPTDDFDPASGVRAATFEVPKLVQVYGGFDGTEVSRAQRRGLFSTTVLTGEIGDPGTNADNSLHVVTLRRDTTLDGFQITDANADLTAQNATGGGVFVPETFGAITIENCTFTRNAARTGGAGILTLAARTKIVECHFEENVQSGDDGGGGGALRAPADELAVVNCIFNRNSARRGGAILAQDARILGCAFSRNSCKTSGGAIYLFGGGSKEITCSSFSQNAAGVAGGAAFGVDVPEISATNSIFWNNSALGAVGPDTQLDDNLPGVPSVRFCVVQGLITGGPYDSLANTNNSGADPAFSNAALDELELSAASPVIDAASNLLVPRDDFDLDGDGNLLELTPIAVGSNGRLLDTPFVVDTGVGPIPLADIGAHEFGRDCNFNGIDDQLEIAGADCNANGVLDECESDCNGNGSPDACDVAIGSSFDCNANGRPDECEEECNGNGVPDDCEIALGSVQDCDVDGIPDDCAVSYIPALDCTQDGIPDSCQIASGAFADANGNGIPDVCPADGDCDRNGISDFIEFMQGVAVDCDGNGVIDTCEGGCNDNGVPDSCDLNAGTSLDCDGNAIPDDCQIADGSSLDCNQNGVPDACDLFMGTSPDLNGNEIPDECGEDGDCDENGIGDLFELLAGDAPDCNANGVVDSCDRTLVFESEVEPQPFGASGAINFGYRIALDGDFLAVVSFDDARRVRLYARQDDGSWRQEASLHPATVGSFSGFGDAIAMHAGTVVIGARNQARVYVYRRTSSGSWLIDDVIKPYQGFPPTPSSQFGVAVDVWNDLIVIGAPNDSEGGLLAGAAYVFRRNSSGDWLREGKYSASQNPFAAEFGRSVTIEGSAFVAGAPEEPGGGAVYCFRSTGTGTWAQELRIPEPTQANSARFGGWVSLDQSTLAVGTGQGTLGRTAYIYDNQAPGLWPLETQLTHPDARNGYGGFAQVDRNFVAVSATTLDESGSFFSGVHLYHRELDGSWRLRSETASPPGPTSIAFADGRLALGAPGDFFSSPTPGSVLTYLDTDANDDGILTECECGTSTSYCQALPNSSGDPALLAYVGSGSVVANDSMLSVDDAPVGAIGFFFHGPLRVQNPMGDGVLCIGGGTRRIGTAQIVSIHGRAVEVIDFASDPAIAQTGSRNFQFAFRDSTPGGLNFSNAIEVRFCP